MPRHRLAALSLILVAFLVTGPVPAAGPQPAAPPPVVIDMQDAPSLGPDTAPVTIVEFGDFQCPFCARGATGLRKLRAIYPDRVRWVFKHYPIQLIHPAAALAHEAAIAAQEQGKFWEMHGLLYSDPAHMGYKELVSYGEQIGLDMAAFKDALDTRRLRPRVIRDLDEARRLHVVATPTYFVNGIRYVGARTMPEFRAIVDSILRQPAGAPTGPAVAPPGATAAPSGAAGAPAGAAGAPAESTATR